MREAPARPTPPDAVVARHAAALHAEIRGCRRCVEAGYAITPAPVAMRFTGQRAYLVGLAPGSVEATVGLPWQGRAGGTLRRWLRLDEDELFHAFLCASVTRCYPGRSASGRGDRTATATERALCATWTTRELALARPELIVTVGGAALRTLLGVERLTDAVGKSYLLGDAIVIPLPHPSGASGWVVDDANRARLGKALVHVRRELARLARDEPSHTIAP